MNKPSFSLITGCVFSAVLGGILWASEDPESQPVAVEATPEEEPAAPEVTTSALPGQPGAVTDQDFTELTTSSPFNRSLNLSDSLILTGIAVFRNDTMATLVDKESKETYVVGGSTNAQGWRMVGVEGDSQDLEQMTAKIAVAGGEVISVRFDENQLKPGESKPGQARGGFGPGGDRRRGDGDRRGGSGGPDPEIRSKMEQLSDDQRRQLFERMGELRRENPNMSRDDMREQFTRTLDRMTRGDRR